MARGKGVALDPVLLRSARSHLGLTQAELAESAEITTRTVQAAEAGRRVAISSARRLASALGRPYFALVRLSADEIQGRLAAAGCAPLPPPEPWAARERELSELHSHASSRDGGLTVLSGPTGIGKTALARRVVPELLSDFSGGIAWLDCWATTPGQLIARQLELAEALGFRGNLPPADLVPRDAFDQAFRHWFWNRPRLLILDDVADPRLLERLCTAETGTVRALITTTRRSVATRGHCVEVGPLQSVAAADLLAAHIGSERAADDPDGVGRLIELCGRVPRSVHIAGRVLTRERYTTPSAYATRVAATPDEPSGLHHSSHADPSDRDAAFTYAYRQLRDRLPSATWELFGALSVFAQRSFDSRWAAAAHGAPLDRVHTYLADLADFYLVRQEPASRESAPPRFSLDAQAQRAATWARGGASTESAFDRLLKHCNNEAKRLSTLPTDRSALEFQDSAAVWRLCLDWAAEQVFGGTLHELPCAPDSVPRAERIEGALRLLPDTLVNLRSAIHEQMPPDLDRWLLAGLAVARATHDQKAEGRLQRLVNRFVSIARPDLDSIVSWCEAAAQTLADSGLPDESIDALSYLGVITYFIRGVEGSVGVFERAADVASSAGTSPVRRAAVLNSLALTTWLHSNGSNVARADECLQEALDCPLEGHAGQLIRALVTVNRAVIQTYHGWGVGNVDLRSALDDLREFIVHDELGAVRLAAVERVLQGKSADGLRYNDLERRIILLSVPPQVVNRRLLHLRELCYELPRHLSATNGMGFAIGGTFAGTALELEIHDPGLLFPVQPVVRLIVDEGLSEVLTFVEASCGRDHPAYAEVERLGSFRAAPGGAKPEQ